MSFVRAVCAAMERVAPLRLAETWDNVRILRIGDSDGHEH